MTRRLRGFGPEVLILLGAAVFAILSHGRHANVTEDHGFWFSAAQSMVTGGRAMHEVRLQWGPMPLWILEGVGRIFGMRVASFVVFQFVVGLLAILAVQIFARRFLSGVERWLCAAILVALIVWMVGPGSLLYPCAFAMSQALLLGMATLFVADGFLCRGRFLAASLAGAVAGVTFLTKQEFGAAAALGIAALTVFRPRLPAVRKLGSLVLSGALFLAAYFGILALTLHGDTWRHLFEVNILWPWIRVPGPWAALYRKVLGLDDPAARVVEAVNSLVDIFAVGGTVWFLLYFVNLRPRARALAGSGLVVAWMLWWWRWTEGSHFLPMTLVLPVIVGSAILALFRWQNEKPHPPTPSPGGEGEKERHDRTQGKGPFFALALGAIVLLQREGYRGNIEAYYSGMGYVLAVPVAAPLIWRAIRGPRSAGRKSLVAAALLLLVVARFGIGRLRTLEREWNATTPLTTARGTVYVANSMAPVLSSTLEFLKANTSPGDSILMMPQTFGMDFLLDRRNLSYFIWISPGYLPDEPELVARLETSPPKAAVIFEGGFGVFHSGQFGTGFADSVVRWLETHLSRQERFGRGTTLPGRWFLP